MSDGCAVGCNGGVDRATSSWRTTLVAEDKSAVARFRSAASHIAYGATGFADRLARAVGLSLDTPHGAAQARAVFVEARCWEVQNWGRFQALTQGCRPVVSSIWPERPTFPPADGETLVDAESKLRELAARLDGAASNAASVLMVPDEVRPPQHAWLKVGINARILAEELVVLRDAHPGMGAVAADVGQWIRDVLNILGGLEAVSTGVSSPGTQFRDLMTGIAAADGPLATDPAPLRHAYVLAGVEYITEVHQKMPDYTEASGQPSRDAGFNITVSGGAVYVGQMAAKITNIESTIQGVANQGHDRAADALRAVEEAVLAESGLDDEARHDLLDNIEYLAESAQQEPGKRSRGMVKQALAALTTAAITGAEISKAMTACGDVLHAILS